VASKVNCKCLAYFDLKKYEKTPSKLGYFRKIAEFKFKIQFTAFEGSFQVKCPNRGSF
jgi:hypothetical protein